jgi:nitrite reductase/ring-hydroxylating ferredoxin subunit
VRLRGFGSALCAGGPLTAGDIEEVDGKACVSCPWHAYKVTIETGEKLYRATELVRMRNNALPAT